MIAEYREMHLSEVAWGLFGPPTKEEGFVMVANDVVREGHVVGAVFAVEET